MDPIRLMLDILHEYQQTGSLSETMLNVRGHIGL